MYRVATLRYGRQGSAISRISWRESSSPSA
jgi:hypothetical protein